MNEVRVRGRQQFLLLAALFFAPLLAAVLLYFVFPDWVPRGHTNYGQLVEPARPLPQASLRDERGADAGPGALRGKWSFVYLGSGACAAACAARLHQIRQVRTLLNEKRLRVQRVYLGADAAELAAVRAQLQAEHPDLHYFADTPDAAYRRFFGGTDPQALYLVDPLGNWLMVYPAGAESKGILGDIKKLLRISQIG
ncbi:SCO family protein [Fontimonas sp. SYSU GA230001]|uniref:SCO family protein n=1 Tax=Fontimonas sp. SYSU GA230001 TaxID=3142450 RepID=UPI0032B42F61